MRSVLFITITLLIAGCANDYDWVTARPNANFQQDLDACVRMGNATPPANGSNAVVNPELSENYVPPINSACAGNFGLFGCNNGLPNTVSDLDSCLMSKGWRMKRAP